jgi:hypothetical protein
MKINPTDVKVPLQKTVEARNGTLEVSLSTMQESHAEVYQNFIANYINQSEVTESTKDKFMAEAIAQFERFKSVILESSDAGLTPAQKKLPPAIQKALLKKQGKGHPDAENKKEQAMETKQGEKEEEKATAAKKAACGTCENYKDGEDTCEDPNCAKCKSSAKKSEDLKKEKAMEDAKAASQKTKNLSKDDIKPIENLDKSKYK